MRKDEFLKEIEWVAKGMTNVNRSQFPDDFVFGVATSAYQIEGGCNEGNRGPSIWDAFTHSSGTIIDGSNGDVAINHYNRYKEDIEIMGNLGFDAYRFSISWSRIFPDGVATKVNEEGVAFYNKIIDTLLEKGIQPCVTLYHWDLPLALQESIGGWLSKEIVKHFAAYADTCFAMFGDRVKTWITINEPMQTAISGHFFGRFAPGRRENPTVEPYVVAHHQILAHSAAVSVYKSKYKEKQGGKIGIAVDCEWGEANSNKVEDQLAATRRVEFQLGWYLDPLYFGDYPKVMREAVQEKLPKFSEEERRELLIPIDFIGLNHYTSRFIAHAPNPLHEGSYYEAQEAKVIAEYEHGEPIGKKAASVWLYLCPWGLRSSLNYIAKKYGDPVIYVTENGMDDEETGAEVSEMLDDKMRIEYYKGYLCGVANAIKDGVNVKGYFAWSLLDNFEWAEGYTKRFGLVYVDYKNGLSRYPKSSAYWFMRFLRGNDPKSSKED